VLDAVEILAIVLRVERALAVLGQLVLDVDDLARVEEVEDALVADVALGDSEVLHDIEDGEIGDDGTVAPGDLTVVDGRRATVRLVGGIPLVVSTADSAMDFDALVAVLFGRVHDRIPWNGHRHTPFKDEVERLAHQVPGTTRYNGAFAPFRLQTHRW